MAVPTLEENLKTLAVYAKENGDEWRLVVSRRTGIGSPLKVAAFDGAKIEHITFPEAWLPQLVGGGEFVFDLYHARNVNFLAAVLPIAKLDGAPHSLDRAAMRSAAWTGPPLEGLFYPPPEKDDRLPPTDLSGLTLPGIRDREGRVATDNTVGADAGRYSVERLLAEMQRRDEEHRRREVALAEERRRIEVESLKASTQAETKRLESKLNEALDAIRRIADRPVEPARPPPSMVEQVVPVIAALTPILAPYLAAAKEAEAKRMEREAAERIEREKREAALHEKLANQGAETAKVMASMADVVSNSMRAQLQTVATMQELLNPPQQEEGLIGVVKEGIRAFAEFASTKAEAEAKAKTERPALPASSGVTTGGAPAAPTPLDDGEEVELSEAAPDEIMAEVIRQLQAHAAPAEVANLYVEALRENPGFVAIVKQAGGTVNAFQARLGSWATAKENYDYLRQVLGALEEIGKRMKQRPPPRPEQAGTTKPAEPAQPAAQPAA